MPVGMPLYVLLCPYSWCVFPTESLNKLVLPSQAHVWMMVMWATPLIEFRHHHLDIKNTTTNSDNQYRQIRNLVSRKNRLRMRDGEVIGCNELWGECFHKRSPEQKAIKDIGLAQLMSILLDVTSCCQYTSGFSGRLTHTYKQYTNI